MGCVLGRKPEHEVFRVLSLIVAAAGDERYLLCAAVAAGVRNRFLLCVLQRVVVRLCVLLCAC